MLMKRIFVIVIVVLLTSIIYAQSSTLTSKGMVQNPVLLEWRNAANTVTKWSQLIVVPAGTVTVPILEPHDFEEGDQLRLSVLITAVGLLQGSISIK